MGLTNDENICFEVFTAYPLSHYLPGLSGGVGIGGLVLGVVYFCSAIVTIFWIKQQQRNALQGMSGAAMHVIFPIYLPYMWLSAASDSFIGLFLLFVKVQFRGRNDWMPSVIAAVAFAFQHFVIEGIAFTLMQYGCGRQAVRNAALWASGWGVTTFFVFLILYRDGSTDSAFIGSMSWNIILFVFYAILWLAPERRLFRRVAVVHYARFWAILRIFTIAADVLYQFGGGTELTVSNCLYAIVTLPLVVVFKPLIVYQALLLDSKWWQGLNVRTTLTSSANSSMFRGTLGDASTQHSNYIKASFRKLLTGGVETSRDSDADADCHGHANAGILGNMYTKIVGNRHKSPDCKGTYDAIKGPLIGVEVGFSEAQELAKEVDNIHQQGTIRLLNFAYLSVDAKAKLLGAGSFSKVYSGYYKGQPVAIKMLFTQDLNPDVIKRCSNEARILSELSHSDNVVKIYGAAVLPPSVCIVLEICEYGSLSDVLRGQQQGGGVNRAALKLSLSDRMFLAYGCAKGLEALHAYSPDLCHRDIKSFNYLIDSQLNAKIADLDLGEHTDCVRGSSDGSRNSVLRDSYNLQGSMSHSLYLKRMKECSRSDMNITWQAPEVLLGQGYNQRSDIHSLSLVLWEIIATGRVVKKFNSSDRLNDNNASNKLSYTSVTFAGVPFSECRNQGEIREKVVKGVRPSINAFVDSHSQDRKYVIDPLYISVMTQAWNPDPTARPAAGEMVQVLRRCWLNSLHRMIGETEYIVDFDKINAENLRLSVLQENGQSNNTPNGGAYSARISQLLSSPFHASEKHMSSSSGSSRRNQMILRHVPSPEVMETLSLMKSEARWAKLEDESTFSTTNSNLHTNAYLVVTAQRPFFMLWATKKWSQMMGYLVNDIIAYELSVLFGPQTQNIHKMETLLDVAATQGQPQHMMLPVRRRDGKEFLVSLHMFPVFDSGTMPSAASSPSAMSSSTLSSFQPPKPAKLSFSGAPVRADYFHSAYAYSGSIADPIKSITNPPQKNTHKHSKDSPVTSEDQQALLGVEEEFKDLESSDARADSTQDSLSLGAVYAARSHSNASNSTPVSKSALRSNGTFSSSNPMVTPASHTGLNTAANTSVFNPPPQHMRGSFSGYAIGGNAYETSNHSDSTLDELMMQEQESQLSILHSVMSAGSFQHSEGEAASHSSNSSFASPAHHAHYAQYSTESAAHHANLFRQQKGESMKKVAYVVLQFSTPKEGL